MGTFLQLCAAAAVVFVAIDAVWLGTIANKLYKSQLGGLLREQPQMLAAVLFYAVFIVALVFFVIQPALERNSWTYALCAGAFFGFVTYATYDLTNLSTLKNWPVTITVIDLIWGSVLSATVSVIAYHIGKWLA